MSHKQQGDYVRSDYYDADSINDYVDNDGDDEVIVLMLFRALWNTSEKYIPSCRRLRTKCQTTTTKETSKTSSISLMTSTAHRHWRK